MFSKESAYFKRIACEINRSIEMHHDVFNIPKKRRVKISAYDVESKLRKLVELSYLSETGGLTKRALYYRLCAFYQWHGDSYILILDLMIRGFLKEFCVTDKRLSREILNRLLTDFAANDRGIKVTQPKPKMSVLSNENLAKGVMYSRAMADMYNYAILLNTNALKESGSIWTTLSAEPHDIGNMISKVIPNTKVVYVNDESIHANRLNLNHIPPEQIKKFFIRKIKEGNTLYHYNAVKLIGLYWNKIYKCIHSGEVNEELSLPNVIEYAKRENRSLIDFIQDYSRTFTGKILESLDEEDVHGLLYEHWGYMIMQVDELIRKSIDCWVVDGLNPSNKENTHYIFKCLNYHDFILLAIKFHKILFDCKPNLELSCLNRPMFVEKFLGCPAGEEVDVELAVVGKITESSINHFFYGASLSKCLRDHKAKDELCSILVNTRYRVVFWDDFLLGDDERFSGVSENMLLQCLEQNILAVPLKNIQ